MGNPYIQGCTLCIHQKGIGLIFSNWGMSTNNTLGNMEMLSRYLRIFIFPHVVSLFFAWVIHVYLKFVSLSHFSSSTKLFSYPYLKIQLWNMSDLAIYFILKIIIILVIQTLIKSKIWSLKSIKSTQILYNGDKKSWFL